LQKLLPNTLMQPSQQDHQPQLRWPAPSLLRPLDQMQKHQIVPQFQDLVLRGRLLRWQG
jgi:hypothetical protein